MNKINVLLANSLFDGVVSEGIATYLEAEFIKDRIEKNSIY